MFYVCHLLFLLYSRQRWRETIIFCFTCSQQMAVFQSGLSISQNLLLLNTYYAECNENQAGSHLLLREKVQRGEKSNTKMHLQGGKLVQQLNQECLKIKFYPRESAISANSIHKAIYGRENSIPGPQLTAVLHKAKSFTILNAIYFPNAAVNVLLPFSSI